MKSPVRNKIGIFGGTFDPVHNTHIDIALASLSQLKLAEVWFLPEKSPRYKSPAATYEQRINMLELACENLPNLKVVAVDQSTHDFATLKRLIETQQMTDFTMIAGMDLIEYLDKWDNFTDFLKHVDFAIVNRPSSSNSALSELINRLGVYENNFKYRLVEFEPSMVSSKAIRSQSIETAAVCNKVKQYIALNNLYHN